MAVDRANITPPVSPMLPAGRTVHVRCERGSITPPSQASVASNGGASWNQGIDTGG